MRDRNRDTREQPERDESLLAVPQPIILVRIRQAVEHMLRIGKIDAMIVQVCFTLRLVPYKPYIHNVSTI
jgi:hypothetical protein